MGYGLLLTYGVFRGNPCPPSWWTENVWDTGGYGLSRVWVTGGSTVHYFLTSLTRFQRRRLTHEMSSPDGRDRTQIWGT